jgi:hypothetical protein
MVQKMKVRIFISLLAAGMILLTTPHCKRTVDKELESYYREQGKWIVDSTFKVLSGHLKEAIADSGIEYAIQYCNLHAMPLADSLSKKYSVDISRRTTRPRNRENFATGRDKVHIVSYALQLKKGGELTANLTQKKGRFTYYQPILVQPMCLVCHGSPESIGPVYETIRQLYPDDQAIHYAAGDLRGVWRVDFLNPE